MKVMLCVLAFILLPMMAKADTLTLTNNSSLNGAVLYDAELFYVAADYRSGTIHYKIPRAAVARDEINGEKYNQGSPGPGITAYVVDAIVWDVAMNPSSTRLKNQMTTTLATSAKTNPPKPKPLPASAGNDVLTLSNNSQHEGSLVKMTRSAVTFKDNNSVKETSYDRKKVKLVTVGQ